MKIKKLFRPMLAIVAMFGLAFSLNSSSLLDTKVVSAQQGENCEEVNVLVKSDATVTANGGTATPTYKSLAWAKIPGATWIWESQFVSEPKEEQTVNFSKTFTVDAQTITSAELSFAADAAYSIEINGVSVDSNMTAETSNYTEVHTETDLASLLHSGENTITATVKNVPVPEFPENTAMMNPAGLIFKLSIVGENCENVPADEKADLNVIMHVVNDNSGTKVAGDFDITVTGNDASPTNFTGSESGTAVTMKPGAYTTTSAPEEGYAITYSADCNGTMVNNDSKTCTITANDNAPQNGGGTVEATLNVKTHVINDDGGSKVAGDFTATVTGNNPNPASFQGSESGVNVDIDPGTYDVSTTDDPGYQEVFSSECSGTIANNETKSCVITYDDIGQPSSGGNGGGSSSGGNTTGSTTGGQVLGATDEKGTLVVIKHVINDNGATRVASDFVIDINGVNPSQSQFRGSESGVTITMSEGAYKVNELNGQGYIMTKSTDCEGILREGETKTCVITNNDVGGTVLGAATDLPGMPSTGYDENAANRASGLLMTTLGMSILASIYVARRFMM